MSELLHVWHEQTLVGILRKKTKISMTFAYDADWLKRPDSFDISLNLPRQSAPFDCETTHAFFVNLLPEQGVRTRIERKLQISPKNDFALLNALGAECAGALVLLSPGELPQATRKYAPLTREKLGELIALLPRRPLLAGESGVRLSLAGAQSKLPLGFIDGHYCLPQNGAPSTLILKPPLDDLPGMVENETFCMRLAVAIGLAVPYVAISDTVPRAYVVRRYDRTARDNKTARLHQEDFCQALGIAPEQKYEKEGGPTLADCFGLLENVNNPAADKARLLDWVIFNFLIGNADGHAKNLSLLYDQPQKPNLAPFYDLICTGVYAELGTKLAMKIGGQYKPDYILPRHWNRLAPLAGCTAGHVLRQVHSRATLLHAIAGPAQKLFERQHGTSPTVRRISAFIKKRCQQTLTHLAR